MHAWSAWRITVAKSPVEIAMYRRRSTPSFFLVGPGHARAVLRPPGDTVGRSAWKRWLAALLLTVACTGGSALVAAAVSATSPAEATARMEQLAAKVARAQVIHPTTAQKIERLVRQPWYDCTQVACSGRLEARNAAARARLTTLLAEKTQDGVVKTAGAQ
jgi:hypothetical protein